ncbi:MAG: Gfo/Idh/MocA family oxidoreductase [Oscillospiraceae bacterium]|jgi:predicted dehydrogenase|nr:Gfo/Idh/MocA family oxidoreductase [Oscillospiraceae bacterium]
MLRVAVVGTGNISRAHIPAWLAFPDRARITAMVDIYPDKAVDKSREFGVDCGIFDDHLKVLDRDDVDLVDICAPPFCHAEIAINSLRAGKHVVVEKPMAASLRECDDMLEAARDSGKTLACIAQNRFRSPIARLKAVLDSGMAGPVRHALIDSLWWRGHCYYDLWWRGLWSKEGGGCTLNHAVHHIDMLGWMMGLPKSVTAVMANTAHDNAEIEDLSVAVFEYPGALATATSSVVHHGEEQSVQFQCEKARIGAPWQPYASISQPNGFPVRDEGLEAELDAFYQSLPAVTHEAHVGEIEDVVSAIERDRPPAITGEDGRRTIEMITAIYKSASLRETTALPISRDDPFYTVEGMLARVPRFYEKTVSRVSLGDAAITVGGDYKK